MRTRLALVALFANVALASCGETTGSSRIVEEPLTWIAPDGGGRIAGAEKRRSGSSGPVVLFFMGATTPSDVAFDLDVPGYSWMEHLAALGHRVVRWDPTGYGASDRPAELDEPPAGNPPLTRSATVAAQGGIVADSVAERTGDAAFHVICWSAGCAPALGFAAERPERVESLVLYGATFGPLSALALPPLDPSRAFTNFLGAYRLTSRDDVAERWDDMIPVEDKTAYREPEVLETWVRDFLASDPTSEQRDPVTARVPNGMLADSYEALLGHPPYQAARVLARALVTRGADDPETNARGSELLMEALGSTRKRYLEIPLGTHYVTVEKNREALWNEVDAFLAEP